MTAEASTIVELLARECDEPTLIDMQVRLKAELRMLNFQLQQVERALRLRQTRLKTRLAEHGRAGTYNRGCRCAPCREAKREYQAAYRSSRHPPGRTPT